MATFTVNAHHLQALLTVHHSGYARSLGHWLAVDGDFYWSAVQWDSCEVKLPCAVQFRRLDEWDCVHFEFGAAIRLTKKESQSGAQKVAGFWRDDKLYRVVDKNEHLRFTTLNACEQIVYQYCFNAIIWFARGPAAAWTLCEMGELSPNFRFHTDGEKPASQISQGCLWGGYYPNADEDSRRAIRDVGRWTKNLYGHVLDCGVIAVAGVCDRPVRDEKEKIWLAVLDQPCTIEHKGTTLDLPYKGLWVFKHPVIRSCNPPPAENPT